MPTATIPAPATARRVLLATFGSLGDLHPFLALAVELRRRGHIVTIATAALYADRVAALGFAFAPIGPSIAPNDPAVIHRIMRKATGPEYLFRKVFLPQLPELYNQLLPLVRATDLFIASEVVFAAPILAEVTGKPWVSALLSPISFLSAHDPSILPPLARLQALRTLPPAFHRTMLNLTALAIRHWSKPLQDFRNSLGLAPTLHGILHEKLTAPHILALFSAHFAAPQPDWPPQTTQTGFLYFDQGNLGESNTGVDIQGQQNTAQHTGSAAAELQLQSYLAAGPRPVVFTLGSAAVHAAEDFFHVSAASAHRLRIRAILISSRPDVQLLAAPNILVVPYADYRTLLPHAAAVVHQGGIGTTAETLRAGIPALVIPFNFDQPDNAARAVRLGVAVSLPRRKYNRRHAYYALHRLLRDEALRDKANKLGELIRKENGAANSGDAVESILSGS